MLTCHSHNRLLYHRYQQTQSLECILFIIVNHSFWTSKKSSHTQANEILHGFSVCIFEPIKNDFAMFWKFPFNPYFSSCSTISKFKTRPLSKSVSMVINSPGGKFGSFFFHFLFFSLVKAGVTWVSKRMIMFFMEF